MEVARNEPLGRFPALHTRDLGELRQRLSSLFSVWSVDLPCGTGSFEAHLNHRQMLHAGVTYARYGASLEACLSHPDFFLQGFPIRGNGYYVVDGSQGPLSRNNGVAGGPVSDVRVRYSSDFEHLILRIKPQGLINKLTALIGLPIDPPLKLESGVGHDPALAADQLRLLEFVAGELDRDDAPLPPLVLNELEQALIVSYLCTNRHNYSRLLEGEPRAVSPWQVLRAQEYIEQNWDQPITVEALAVAVDTSVRNLFYSFKKSRGMSPMTFVRQVRLARARDMLMLAAPDTNVTSVAFACGFSNLGHFAKNYHQAFGEHPSATLRTALLAHRKSDRPH